ncbi:uncharacterized protein LODBEIA_P55620 [Lodderomyces beijingensis]|uniref:Alpha/beta hydrolase fold-3 domain-containing protein n=1 Tax=Lodderomyces beijingensis TaxID=1775926 RepID=A0ABP0ZT70_9ASCO
MSSLTFAGLLVLISIPFKLLYVLLCYPFRGGVNPKFRSSLSNSLKWQLSRTALSMPVPCAWILSIPSAKITIRKVLPFKFPALVQGLGKYGEQYDDQSIWLVEAEGRDKADPIIIFLHGGGYFIDARPEQFESVLSIYHLLEPEKKATLSVLYLDYKLAHSGHTITTQLHQLVETYQRLTVQDGNSNIILMGDSAGGHLAITFLQYIRQTKDETKMPWPKSVILISPAVKVNPEPHQFETGWSYFDNKDIDMVQYKVIHSSSYQNAIVGELDITSLLVSPGNAQYKHGDWDDIPTFTQSGYSSLTLVGEHESLRDDVLEWCRYAVKSPLTKQKVDSMGIYNADLHQYKNEGGGDKGARAEVYVEPWGIHDAVLFFENHVAAKVARGAELKHLDPVEFFGIVKVTEFLNTILECPKNTRKEESEKCNINTQP